MVKGLCELGGLCASAGGKCMFSSTFYTKVGTYITGMLYFFMLGYSLTGEGQSYIQKDKLEL